LSSEGGPDTGPSCLQKMKMFFIVGKDHAPLLCAVDMMPASTPVDPERPRMIDHFLSLNEFRAEDHV